MNEVVEILGPLLMCFLGGLVIGRIATKWELKSKTDYFDEKYREAKSYFEGKQ